MAVGLAMDCFAVSVAKGIGARRFMPLPMLLMALLFGLFQGLMPLVSYCAGIWFAGYIAAFDHWIAFGLLGYIGQGMIRGSLGPKPADATPDYSLRLQLSLSVATSIDALASGIIFVSWPQWIVCAVLVIGAASFLFSCLGSLVGVVFGRCFRLNVELIGGILLIGIGIKILAEHLLAA